MLRIKVIILLIASLFISTHLLADTTPPLSAAIEILEVNENDKISISLKFTLKNESENNIEILKWGTPFEGEFTSDCFDVRYDGEQVPYRGILVKRGAPQPADFIEIAANQEISEIVHLEGGYEIYKAGLYTVQYREDAIKAKTPLLTQTGDAQAESFRTKLTPTRSNEAEFILNIGLNEPVTLSQPLATSVCSDAEMDTINSALRSAGSIASTAIRSLRNAPANLRPQAQRYKEWFGAYAASRYSTVTTHFDRISDALANRQIYVSCPDDRPNVYAYVYPDKPYTIYFCGAFWRAPLNGTDSKAGTFVHEMSHFNVVAGTKDHVYGQNNARNLARSNPATAINNADSHEYFAENTPPLAMPAPASPPSSDDDDGDSSGCFVQSLGD